MLKPGKDPEITYGTILIIVATIAILLIAAFGGNLNHTPIQNQPKLFIEFCIIFIAGVLLLFKKRNFLIGRKGVIVLLVLIALCYIELLISEIRSDGINFAALIYFVMFFMMNLLIMKRILDNGQAY